MCSEVDTAGHTVESYTGAIAGGDTCCCGFRWCPADETVKSITSEVLFARPEAYVRAAEVGLQEEMPPELVVLCVRPETSRHCATAVDLPK